MALTRPKYSQIPDTDFKQSVRVATTADIGNVMLATMPNTVDGVSLNFYDRVLVRAQANAAQNGIYQVIAVGTGSNGIWERTKDANAGSDEGKVTPAIVTLVEEGTINSGRTFRLTTTGNITLGTTNLSFGITTAEPAGSLGQLQFANVNNQLGGINISSFDYTTGNLTLGSVNILGSNLTVPNLYVTTNSLFQAGKRVPQITSSATPPLDPAEGDQWYQVGTDILYEWINDGGTAYWVDVTGATIANVNPVTGQTVGTLVVNSGEDSTSANTGALQVVGGVGISGNIYVGGQILTSAGVGIGGNLSVSSTTPSTSETTGALVIPTPGGLGIGGNIWAGGTIVANSRVPSTSTTTGALIIPGTGGLGIGGNIWAGGDVTILGNITGGGVRQTISSSAPADPTVGDQWYQLGTDILYQYVNDGTNRYWVDVSGATVANITAYNQQSLNDIAIVSGTPSTSATTGALQVAGGVGITGNLYLQGNLDISGGNIIANQNVTSTNTTTGSMVVTGQGGIGVGGNINIGGNLSVLQTASFAQNVQIAANLTSGGTYFSAAGVTADQGNITATGSYFGLTGLTVNNGNITATGNTAVIGGLTIIDGGISSLASLAVIGSGTIGGNLDITGAITGGGIRKTSSATAPANPVVGDVWYKTDTDVYYQYINDGASNFWIDIAGATVSNANPTSPQSLQDLEIVSGTPSTDTTTGALVVTGGAGVSGNVNAGNISATNISAELFTYANGTSILAGNEGTYSNANVLAYLAANGITATSAGINTTGNITASGLYFAAAGLISDNGNITASGNTAIIGGLTITDGGIGDLANLSVLGSGTVGGDLAITGNVTGGGLRKYAQAGAPANPIVGDVWYKTDTDVFYQYVNDGTNKYWIDYTSATVSNANPTSPQSLQDLQIVSGTPSTGSGTGALQVTGGAAVTGNVFAGNLSTATIAASNFTYANGVSILLGNEGTYSNANVTAYLTARNVTIADGNITATGGYLAAGGFIATAGNIRTTSANIGGVIIESGGIGSLASLGVIGSATIGADLAVTGNITGGGLRKYAQVNAPINAVPGDVWYKTDTDVYYTYVNDGTSSYWIDYVGATVSNAAVDNSTNNDFTIASGTASTDADTGALVVVGGVGVTGDINVTGDFSIDGTFTACTAVTAGYLNVADGIDSYGNVVIHGPGTPNYTVQVRSSDAADDVLGIKTSVAAGGFEIDALNSELTGATPFGINANTFSIGIKNAIGSTVQADAFKINTTGNASVAKTLSVGQHVNVTGNVNAGVGTFTSLFASSANLTTLNLSGTLTVPTLNVTTSIDAPGIRKYAQTTAPVSPAVGDVWYKTDTDVYYTYVNDGTTNYWIDYVGATVSNAATTASQSVDLRVASGTESTNTDTGALTVVGGVGVVGNIFAGGIVSAQGQLRAISGVQSTSTTTGALVITGGLGVSANTNIGGALAADSLTVAGPSNLFGNLSGTNMSLSGRADIIGSATIGGNLDITGAVTGGGIRKTTSATAPASPVVGDLWYKTDTDVLYQYINDGANNYWVDYVGPTVSNASIETGLLTDLEIVTGTVSTDSESGALRVVGGAGITGNIFAGGLIHANGNIIANSQTASTSTTTGAMVIAGSGGIGIGGAAWIGTSANIGTTLNVGTSAIIGTTLNIGGNIIAAGRADIAGDVAITGNVTGGGIRKTTSLTAPANPIVGDLWYKTDTDVLYQYINDGTTNFWVDYVGPTVSNASIDSSSAVDFSITSGTSSTDTETGALRIAGGVGISGNIFAGGIISATGNLVANATTPSTNTTTGALTVKGGAGIAGATYIGGLLDVGQTIVASGNISSSNITTGQGNFSGNIYSVNGAFSGRIDVIGSAVIGGDLAVTGNVTGGGLRKYAQPTAPSNPVPGDVWYKTDTDVYYTYVNDGTTSYWIDYVGPTVSNAAVDNSTNNDFTIASGTASVDSSTGALKVVGGVGVTGNINTVGDIKITSGTRAVQHETGALVVSGVGGASIGGNLFVQQNIEIDGYFTGLQHAQFGDYILAQGDITSLANIAASGNLTAGGQYFSAGGLSSTNGNITAFGFSVSNGNISASGARATLGGLTIENGSFGNIASLAVIGSAVIGGDLAVTGNVSGGGLRKYAQPTAPVNPVPGDVWYKTDTDVYYQFINDGSNTFWVDFVSAAVANVTQSAQTVSDIVITSGTPSVGTGSGALQVAGGAAITGNVYAGNVIAINFTGDIFTYANGVSILAGNEGTYSNANVVAYLAANGITATSTGITTTGNISAVGNYLSAGGITALAGDISAATLGLTGNINSAGSRAVLGGLIIENGGFGNLTSLGVIGSAVIGGDVTITGNVTGGGIRKTTSTTAPVNPVVGDLWYKTDTDILYQFINDGSNTFWVDFVSASVSNSAADVGTNNDFTIASGTAAIDYSTGALRVVGGAGITGNIFAGNNITAGGDITATNATFAGNLSGANLNTGIIEASGAVSALSISAGGFTAASNSLSIPGVFGVTATGNLTAGGQYFSAGGINAVAGNISVGNVVGTGFSIISGNLVASGTTATIGGLVINNGGFGSLASLDVTGNATVGGNVSVTGNITGGGLRKYAQSSAPAAPVVGDIWYKTDTDVVYEYINDGTSNFWVDLTSASVANVTASYDNLGDLNVVGNITVTGGFFRFANGTPYITTTLANTNNITANLSNGFDVGLDLTTTGAVAGNYGSATSIPTVVVDDYGRITSITSNSVSTTFGLQGNIGSSTISGGNTLVVLGVPNQIQTTVSGNSITIGFTPNISFTDFTVTGNLVYGENGLRTTTSATPPADPTPGDMWYQSGTDILYRYINDGTSEYWVDFFSTPLRAILPEADIGGGDGEVQYNDNGTFGANANFSYDQVTGSLKVPRFRITQSQSPASSSSPGQVGEITWDGSWLYVCVAPNTWHRAGLYPW